MENRVGGSLLEMTDDHTVSNYSMSSKPSSFNSVLKQEIISYEGEDSSQASSNMVCCWTQDPKLS